MTQSLLVLLALAAFASALPLASVSVVINPKYVSNPKVSAVVKKITSTTTSHKATSTSTSISASSTSSSDPFGLASLPKLSSGIAFGWLPADGSAGTAETIQQILASTGQNTSTQGYYGQAYANTLFDGSQFTGRKTSIVAAGGVFQPAVMPISWWGLTNYNNEQAVAICTVMKEFTDAGVETWLRFAHEANWYIPSGTYQGTVADYLEAWVVVATTCKSIAPKVKMFWAPNIDTAANYAAYWPGAAYVDVVGVDYYPKAYAAGIFLTNLQAFHDTYTSSSIIMAQGETALAVNAGLAGQLKWAEQITSAAVAAAMPNLKAISWFNFDKEYNYKIANTAGDSVTKTFLSS